MDWCEPLIDVKIPLDCSYTSRFVIWFWDSSCTGSSFSYPHQDSPFSSPHEDSASYARTHPPWLLTWLLCLHSLNRSYYCWYIYTGISSPPLVIHLLATFSDSPYCCSHSAGFVFCSGASSSSSSSSLSNSSSPSSSSKSPGNPYSTASPVNQSMARGINLSLISSPNW